MDTTIENMINSIDLSAPVPEYEPMRQYYYLKACRKIVKEKSEALNRPLNAVVSTFGCQMNARDSEKLLGILKDIGYQESDDEENADFVIYNTCTVRENANLRVYGRLGQLKKVKRANGEMIIAMCGCMMQEPEVVEKIKTSYKFVDIVFGTFNIFKLAELMYMCFTGDEQVIDIWDSTKEVVEELPTSRKYPFKSGVNIMFGCNNFCTYCIVPYVRGREKSREPKEIIREIERLVSDGVKEVMLLGQNVNSYGKTLDDNVTFAELLREIAKIDGLERIRFMTPHPKDLSDELIEAIRDNSKICNHIHLPLQSGSSRLLKLMNRQYTKEHYLELVDKIRNTIPDISANVLCAEKNNGCVCSEKSDNRSCDKLDQYRDDQTKSNGDHHGIAKRLLCTVILSGTDILSCECRNSRKNGRRNQEQKADDFFHNADSSGCVQSAPVGNDRNNNESNLNKSVLKRYRNPNIQNFAKRFFLWAETVSGKRKSGLLTFNGNQCKQNTTRLGKCCAKRSTGSSQMEKSDKQIIQYNIHRTCNCDEIHRTFRIPQSAENRTDHIIRRNKRNPEKTDRQISCRS